MSGVIGDIDLDPGDAGCLCGVCLVAGRSRWIRLVAGWWGLFDVGRWSTLLCSALLCADLIWTF